MIAAETKSDPRYLIVFGACLTQFTVIGLLFSYGLFFKVFEAEYGWSRAMLSGAASLTFFMMGMLAIFGGRLSDRYGPRVVLATTGTLYGLGFGLISQVTETWHLFLIFGLFISLGMSTHDVVTLSTVARWFDRRRGMMTGVVKVGTAIGQIAVPPSAALLMASLGWRSAAIAMGIVAAVLLLIAALSMKQPLSPSRTVTETRDDGLGFREVAKTRIFWTLCAIQFLYLPSLVTIPLHIVVHGMDMGMSATIAATLLSVTGAASVVGRLGIGTFADRIGGKRAFVLCFLPLIASLLAFVAIASPWLLFAAVAVYGFAHGGLFTVVAPAIAEYFGTRAHGTIFGAVVFFGTFGAAIGPTVAGRIFDTTGSYDLAFITLAAMAALGLSLVLSLPRRVPARQA